MHVCTWINVQYLYNYPIFCIYPEPVDLCFMPGAYPYTYPYAFCLHIIGRVGEWLNKIY